MIQLGIMITLTAGTVYFYLKSIDNEKVNLEAEIKKYRKYYKWGIIAFIFGAACTHLMLNMNAGVLTKPFEMWIFLILCIIITLLTNISFAVTTLAAIFEVVYLIYKRKKKTKMV